MYPTLCKVEYWDEGEIKTDNCLIYADTFVDAAQKIEDYYGKEIESLSIKMFDVGVWRVDDATAAHITEDL